MARLIPLIATGFAIVSTGQQLEGYYRPYDLLGLSDRCFAAINTTVSSCPAWLGAYGELSRGGVQILKQAELETLCETTCRNDLARLRTRIKSSCTESTDIIVPGGSVAYPATFVADRLLYASGLSCMVDPATKKYCDVIVADWMSRGTEYTAAQTCSYCQLHIMEKQLGSPFGYSEQDAEDFTSLVSSCSETTYGFVTPTVYALNATTIVPYTPTCTATYEVQPGDSCVSISGANNVSTYGLITENALDIGCNHLEVRRVLCLPQPCRVHQLELDDSCKSLQSSLNITMAQILAWNPIINSGCSNLASRRGWYLCASSPSGTGTVGEGNSVTTVALIPTDAQGQSSTRCATWHRVEKGEYCSSISLQFGISLADFFFLNPQVDENCTNLWLDTSYCVQAVGNIATYPGYPDETPAYTFTKPTPTSFTPVTFTLPPLNPTAPGTVDDCLKYENPFTPEVAARMEVDLDTYNSCDHWASFWEITVEDLISWNPSLSRANCMLDYHYSYCLRRKVPAVEPLPFYYCWPPNSTLIPAASPQPEECACYIQMRAEQQSYFSCTMFPSVLNITVDTVTRLNPWIGSDCDTGIWTQMSTDGFVQLCVIGRSSTTTPMGTSSTTASYPPAKTQTGAAADCSKWHVVGKGDGCWAIANEYGISLDDFYLWNPGVGSDCEALWLGYAVCVGV